MATNLALALVIGLFAKVANPASLRTANHLGTSQSFIMPSFETTVSEIREGPPAGFIVILKPNELETTTNLNDVLMEPKFANAGGKIHHDHLELYCEERPPIHEGQVLMIRSLDPHGE